jgi:hypothetical protein
MILFLVVVVVVVGSADAFLAVDVKTDLVIMNYSNRLPFLITLRPGTDVMILEIFPPNNFAEKSWHFY